LPKSKGDGLRAATIRDAKKLGLLPSVTNILGVIAKPGLDKWKLNQVALAAFASPPDGKESEDYYTGRIIEAAFTQVVQAADLGSKIHDGLEKVFEGEAVPEDLLPYEIHVLAEGRLSFERCPQGVMDFFRPRVVKESILQPFHSGIKFADFT
jgi:hypothetical protein